MSQTKPRIMVVSDHSSLHTGFANVSRHILNYIFDTGKYEVSEFGWFAPRVNDVAQELMPRWQVYVTNRSNPDISLRDQYGKFTLEGAIVSFKPDVVLSIGDEWMVNHIIDLKEKYGFLWIGYTPIDGMPHPQEWAKTFAAMDYCVAYGKWGIRVMRQRNPNINAQYIYHGVDSNLFKPDKAARETVRKIMGITDEWLIGFVGRNQPRKMIPILFKAFAMWTKRHAWCPTTKLPFIVEPSEFYINELFYTPNEMPFGKESRQSLEINGGLVSPFTGKACSPQPSIVSHPTAKLYLHCALNDVGWNISEQINRYRLGSSVITNDQLRVGHGVSDNDLAAIYNAFDVFTLPTIGEGFGLPILEAMSCGVPIAVTDYSGHTEWCRDAGWMLKPKVFFTETFTNIERAIVDNVDYVKAFDHLFSDKESHKRYSHNGRFIAERMDWNTKIVPEWERLIDHVLLTRQAPKPQIDSGSQTAKVEIC